jgi:hypothetical protein
MTFVVDISGFDAPTLTGPFKNDDEAHTWLQEFRPDVEENWDGESDVWVVTADDPVHTGEMFKNGGWAR